MTGAHPISWRVCGLAVAIAGMAMACQPVGATVSEVDDPMTLGLKLMREGQPAQALGAFNRALALEVTAETLTGAASAYHALGRRKEARQLLQAAIERDGNFALARNNLGIMLYEDGEYIAAEQQLRRAQGGGLRSLMAIAAEQVLGPCEAPLILHALRSGRHCRCHEVNLTPLLRW